MKFFYLIILVGLIGSVGKATPHKVEELDEVRLSASESSEIENWYSANIDHIRLVKKKNAEDVQARINAKCEEIKGVIQVESMVCATAQAMVNDHRVLYFDVNIVTNCSAICIK